MGYGFLYEMTSSPVTIPISAGGLTSCSNLGTFTVTVTLNTLPNGLEPPIVLHYNMTVTA